MSNISIHLDLSGQNKPEYTLTLSLTALQVILNGMVNCPESKVDHPLMHCEITKRLKNLEESTKNLL